MSKPPTAPGTPDRKGAPFDPVIHQTWKNGPDAGQARTSKDGLWVMKSRVNIPAARARAAKAGKPPAKAPPRPATAPAKAATTPVETPPESDGAIINGGGVDDLMAGVPKVTAPGGATAGAPPVEGAAPTPEGPPPTQSTIGPEPVAAGGDVHDEVRGTAVLAAGLGEMVGRVVFDSDEWELDDPRRKALTDAVEADLRANGGPTLTPRQRLIATCAAVFGPNLAKPKTREKIGGWWKRLFGGKDKSEEEAAKP